MLGSSMVSMPDIFSGGKFLGVTSDDLNPLKIDTYTCPRGTRITLYQDKLISSTKITGMNGSIKEMSGFDDWHLTIEFMFIPWLTDIPSFSANDNAMLPSMKLQAMTFDELEDILKIWKKQDSLPVVHEFLNELKIEHIVLTKFEIPNRDRSHELPVRLEALSDEVIDLNL